MAKRGRPSKPGRPGAKGGGSKELLGKRIWKKYPNHYLVGGGVAGLGAIIFAQQQGWIPEIIPLDMFGLGTKTPWSIANPVVAPGTPVSVTGKHNKQVYYTVTDTKGQKVSSGMLGGPGEIAGSIPTTGLPETDYTVNISDTPEAPAVGGAPGKTGYQMTTISPVEGGQPSPVWSPAGGITTNQAGGFQQTQGGANLTLSRFGRIVPLGTT